MNKKLKVCLEVVLIAVLTFIVTLSSPFNLWITNSFTDVQNEILDIAYSVREGYLAYVELDGHYGPVVYEFFGLGYLAENAQLVHYIMEFVLLFVGIMYTYKTAKLFTSEIFAFVATGILTIFGWGSLTHAGAEEILFFFVALTSYHVARQLKSGYLSYHTYLLAIDFGLVFFLQPGYAFIWLVLIIFFAVKFKLDGLEGKKYRSYYASVVEGIITVGVPMGLYLWYFKNAGEFFTQVVVYNIKHMGGFAGGLKILCVTPWSILFIVLVVAIIIKKSQGGDVTSLCCWIGLLAVAIIVIALQGDNLSSFIVPLKAFYIVPLAAGFSLIDKAIGLKVEEREF